jgi:hypothetical protein
MTDQHPLTDEICEELSSCITTLKSGDVDPYISPFDVKVDMQRAADWQLEQVIQAWEQCYETFLLEEPTTNIQIIHRFDLKLKAMRP